MAMSWGSTHIWDYDESPEEYFSDSELEEGSEEETEDSGTASLHSSSTHIPVQRSKSKDLLLKQLRYCRALLIG